VLLLERRRFPRPKVCAGCLSLRIAPLLDPSYRDVVERTVHGVRFTFRGGREHRRRSETPLAELVSRVRFDAHLAERAVEAGARLEEEAPVLAVEEHREAVVVETPRASYRARFLIGADGATGPVAKALGLGPGPGRRRIAVALEGEAPSSAAPATLLDEVAIDWGAVPHGYGWAFPKEDHLSIGVAGDKAYAGHPRPHYLRLLAAHGVDPNSAPGLGYLVPFHGWRLPRLATRRALLIGDAAGLADPLLLEGIYYAVESAHLAAASLGLGSTRAYRRGVARRIAPELRAALSLAFLLHRLPELGYRLLTTRERFLLEYFRVLRGESSYQRLWAQVLAAGLTRLIWPFGLTSKAAATRPGAPPSTARRGSVRS
jgi:geranylgeranyl reductase family protein